MNRSSATRPTAVYTLSQSAVPMILPSSGSSNATGQITLTTALPYQPSGTCFIWLPTGVITAGSQGTGANLYSVTFSSTTVCQLTGTGLVSANGAYTQTTAADITLATVTVPGGTMGLSGRALATHLWSALNNANAKTVKVRIGGAAGTLHQSLALTSLTTGNLLCTIANRGAANSQVSPNQANTGVTTGGAAAVYGAIDTSVDTTIVYQAQIAVATDYMILEAYNVQIAP